MYRNCLLYKTFSKVRYLRSLFCGIPWKRESVLIFIILYHFSLLMCYSCSYTLQILFHFYFVSYFISTFFLFHIFTSWIWPETLWHFHPMNLCYNKIYSPICSLLSIHLLFCFKYIIPHFTTLSNQMIDPSLDSNCYTFNPKQGA